MEDVNAIRLPCSTAWLVESVVDILGENFFLAPLLNGRFIVA
jgi:hypothetical protein